MSKLKYTWEHGDNGIQEYYETNVQGTDLLVFKNRWSTFWVGMVNDRMIHDKTKNDRQRKKQGLEKGCDIRLLNRYSLLCADDPYTVMRKAEYCFDHGLEEISA